MRPVKFFVASSVVEFETERQQLGDFVLDLNGVFRDRGVQFDWRKPEHMSIALSRNGSQTDFDQKVRESQFFFMLVGHKLGEYTEREFNTALEQQEQTGFPIIVPFFLSRAGDWPSESAVKFRNRLKDLGYYPDRATFPDMGQIKLALLMELERSGLLNGETPEEADEQKDADRALERIAARIRDNDAKADALKEQGLTWNGTIPQIVELYEENVRLVKKYHVEPDAVYRYAVFLYRQHAYPEAIDLLDWLGQLYAVQPSGQEAEARRLNLLGICHDESNHFEKAERYYTEAMEIYRMLEKANPAAYEPDVAGTCNNLGLLLSDTNRMEEAERYYTEALEIHRKLAKANPAAYEPDVAGTCNNLGNLLSNTNRMEEAERYYTEALEIRRRLAKSNPAAYEPYVAMTCNNLGLLLYSTNRMEEAERYYTEALEIYRKLAKSNPAAYEPYVADTLGNLGLFLSAINKMDEAESKFRETIDIRRKLAKNNPSAYESRLAQDYNNLGNLLSNTNRMEEAERYYTEALKIRRRLAKSNPAAYEPYVATTCNNLGILLSDTNRMEEAERYYREALESYQRLAEKNPGAYEPYVADTCYNLALLMEDSGRGKEAEALFREALTIFEKYPHRAKDAEKVRLKLELLDLLKLFKLDT